MNICYLDYPPLPSKIRLKRASALKCESEQATWLRPGRQSGLTAALFAPVTYELRITSRRLIVSPNCLAGPRGANQVTSRRSPLTGPRIPILIVIQHPASSLGQVITRHLLGGVGSLVRVLTGSDRRRGRGRGAQGSLFQSGRSNGLDLRSRPVRKGPASARRSHISIVPLPFDDVSNATHDDSSTASALAHQAG